MKSRSILLFLIVFVLPMAWVTQGLADEKSPAQGGAIQVHGDAVEYFNETQKVVGTGNVSIDYEGALLTADKITVNLAAKVALAEGHVVLTQKGSIFKGDRGEYNFDKKIGNVSNMNAAIEPSYYGKAQTIERVSEHHYRAKNSSLTTCCGDSPFYRIQAQQVDIYPGEKVEARNALLFIKDVPVLYIPYFVTYLLDFERFPIQIIPGKNSEWGAFVLTKYRYHLADSQNFKSRGNLLLDYRAKRGLGGGGENFYRGDTVGRGALRTYIIDDQDAPSGIDSQRYRVQWRHQMKWTKDTTFTTEINKLSDATIIKDFFFREEYERDVFPDNYVSVITAKPEYTLSLLARARVDDFFNVVERTPEIRFDTHNRQFVETPFYLRQEAQFSVLKKTFAGDADSLDANRLETNHTLLYAGHVGDLSVTPRIGTHQTYYSRDNAGERNHVRATVDPGLDASIKFFKIYDIYIKAFGLDYNQIRHIFTPTASYNYRPNPTVARTTLQQFDSLDALDKQNFVRYAFENKLQTKNHSDIKGELYSREIARIIPFVDHDLHTGRLDNVGMDIELRPYAWLGIEGDGTYNTRTRDFETVNADVYFTRGALRVALGQRYVQHESSQATTQVDYRINSEWSFKVYERYEFQESKSKEFEVTVSKAFNCVITDLTYNHRDGDAFFFVVRLKAFPTASFGLSQTYNRPKAPPREF